MSNAVAIVRQTSTTAITFVDKPSPEMREVLKRNGYRFENGNWYRSDSNSSFADQQIVDQLLNQ